MRPIDILFPARQGTIDAGFCVICDAEVVEFRNEASAREFQISGMCQACQDKIFG